MSFPRWCAAVIDVGLGKCCETDLPRSSANRNQQLERQLGRSQRRPTLGGTRASTNRRHPSRRRCLFCRFFFRTDATRRIGAESLFAAADWPTRETESAPGMQMMPGSAVSPAGRAGRCAIGRRRWPGVGSFLEPAVRGARGGEPKWRRRWGRSGRTGVGPARGVGRRDGGANASAVAFW